MKISDVVEKCVEKNVPVVLVGRTGSGRIKILKELAKKLGKVTYILNGFCEREDALGHWSIQGDHVKWIDDVIPTALKEGAWLIYNELDTFYPEMVATFFEMVLTKSLKMREHNDEIIKFHKDFRLFATVVRDIEWMPFVVRVRINPIKVDDFLER